MFSVVGHGVKTFFFSLIEKEEAINNLQISDTGNYMRFFIDSSHESECNKFARPVLQI